MDKQTVILKALETLLVPRQFQPIEAELAAISSIKAGHPYVGKQVIVRARDAGVHYGRLVSVDGRHVVLTDSRRMYYWWAKKGISLSAVANYGLKEDESLKITGALEYIDILDACEVIPCTTECVASFDRVAPYEE